tara:strand:+ start:52 stop:975 length:924 start_codon:yes stop_codon:yes gene_type:complete
MKVILSIVVCTYNREKYILKNLEHCYNQSLDKSSYEVILVNNNSPDNTEQICLKFQKEHPDLQMVYSNERNQGHTWARNRGIKESKGSYISFLDDDAFVYFEYAENLIKTLDETPEAIGLGGRIYPVYEGFDEPKWMSPYLLTMVAALDKGDKRVFFKRNKFPIGANMAFRAGTFDQYGLFDVNLGRRGNGLEGGDEKELAIRLKRGNERLVYAPDVKANHIIPRKRIEMWYIKGLAIGIGHSEQRRLKKEPFSETLKKSFSEMIKIGGTFVIAFIYGVEGHFEKAWMLIKFRFWITTGFVTRPPKN